MTKEQIKNKRNELNETECVERSEILESFRQKYKPLYQELENACGLSGHEYQTIYYNFGSFDDRRYTHTPKKCKYCRKFMLFNENNLTYEEM